MKRIEILILITFLFVSCEKNFVEINKQDQKSELVNLKSLAIIGNDAYVSPSGDITGETDTENIKDALNHVKTGGGAVYLTDGDQSSADQYYISKNIICESFTGTFTGEGKDKTIIIAGRKSDTEGFTGEVSPWWSLTGSNSYIATIFQFDNAEGDVNIRDLTIKVNDEQPTNIQPDYYGNDATYISTFIEILGGEHNTTINNIRLLGKESNAFGNIGGMNVRYGIHVMLGSPINEIVEKGILTIKNVEIKNTGHDAVLFMRFSEGSKITIDKVKTINVGRGIQAGNVFGSKVNISKMDILIHPQGYQGIAVWNIPEGLKILNNTIRESNYFGILFWPGINNSAIVGNKFIDIENNLAGIFVNGVGNSLVNNDFKESGLPGWTDTTPDGPGAIILRSSSKDNVVQFSQNNDKSLCEMILDQTDNPTTIIYDGLNTIHNYQPCENLANRDLKFEFMEIEPPGMYK